MFNFENPKNPNRKKGKDYQLSENSKLTNVDFAYSNKLASKIYRRLKILQKGSCDPDSFMRLSQVVYQAVRNDQEHELGQLQLGYGSVEPLKEFRISKKTSWQTFFMNYPTAYFEEEKGELCLAIPSISARELNHFPERTNKVVLNMHCIQVSIGDENLVTVVSSKELIITNKEDVHARSVYFPIKDKSNVVLLCVVTVRIWLMSTDDKTNFLSDNTKFMTAEIFDALLIRNGQLCQFEEMKQSDIKPPELPDSDERMDWV
jgi:hypothetical protein